ncbi:MAG: helix-turn-helix domain-containing protein [Eubacterium sp.]|nr:helix-turn-helix domain-containing protein [Eubacterium sp.]
MILWDLFAENGNVHFELKRDLEYKAMWNKSLEILYVLTGNLSCSIQDTHYELTTGDFILFNPYELHFIDSGNSRVLSMFIHPGFLNAGAPKQQQIYFQCCSTDDSKPHRYYDTLRSLIADMFLLHVQDSIANDYQINSYALQILAILNKNFLLQEGARVNNPELLDDRVIQAIEYIDQNYAESLTAASIGQALYLSPRTLMSIFQKKTGMSVSSYLRLIRLAHARNDIIMTNDSIAEIALRNGFTDTSGLISNFRKYYGKTPLQYRKKQSVPIQDMVNEESKENEYVLDSLLLFASSEQKNFRIFHTSRTEHSEIRVDYTKKGHPASNTWQELLNVGWAKEALLAPLQQQIHRARRELGFRSIRFHGIFDDDMQIYRELPDGTPAFNFTYTDMLFDFLVLQEGLNLHLELGFLPEALAKDKTSYYNHHSYPCGTNSLKKWHLLVFEFVKHCTVRYGLNRVSSWRFEVFSSKFVFYNTLTREDWWDLYRTAYNAVKAVSPALAFGINNDLALILSQKFQRFSWYLNLCRTQNCMPDFLSLETFHGLYHFTDGAAVMQSTRFQHEPPTPHSEDPDYLDKALTELSQYLKVQGFENLPVYISHWSSTDWQQEYSNDTLFKAAFLVKNILNNQERVHAMGHWTLSDLMEEVPHNPDLFHGGIGLLTTNGIPKAGYYAYVMLHALEKNCIAQGRGYCVTKGEHKLSILLYHYEHDELIYQMRTNTRGEDWLAGDVMAEYQILLENMPENTYTVQTTMLDREHGSSYDTWVRIGAPSELLMEQTDYISNISRPITSFQTVEINGAYELQFRLRSNELCLIQIEPRGLPKEFSI